MIPAFFSDTLTFKFIKLSYERTNSFFKMLGNIMFAFCEVLKCIFRKEIHFKNLFANSSRLGVDSLGIAILLVSLSGMIISFQISKQLMNQGVGDYIGAIVAASVLRELAPVMASFAIISMLGSAIASEIASMKVTEQIDAMKATKVNPFEYLITPIVLSGTIMMPVVTIISGLLGLLAGMVVAYLSAEHPFLDYIDGVWKGIGVKDLFIMQLKAAVFGFVIFLISTSTGFETKGGAVEVGESTTNAVVWSFVAIIIFDCMISKLFYGG